MILVIYQAVVRPSGGHAVVLKWSMKSIYGIKPGEVSTVVMVIILFEKNVFDIIVHFRVRS